MSQNNGYHEFELVAIEAPEVGEKIDIETGVLRVRATWLGTVSDGRELGQAMQLMTQLTEETQEAIK